MLPHIQNSAAGVNKWEPVNVDIFQVFFTIPAPLQNEFGADVAVLSEQVQKISGLGSLDRGPAFTEQKFMGTTRSFLADKLGDGTAHELKVTVALNLRNAIDNFIYRLFKAWNHLGYNIEDGTTALKVDYTADFLRVQVANRAQDVYRDIIYKDVMMGTGFQFQDELNYETQDNQTIEVTFRSDWAKEVNATAVATV